MEKLIIEPKLNTPGIILDPEKNQYKFSGESRPEDVRNFYMPILEWLENNCATLSAQDKGDENSIREFHFNFEYFNSTSAKYILDLFKLLSKMHTDGNCIKIFWHYEEDDEDMEITDETPLISSGIVDSFSMVSLKRFLEKKFGTEIPDAKATPEAFDTIGGIIRLLDELGA